MAQTHESGDKAHYGVAAIRANGDYDTDGGVALAGSISAVDVTASGDVSGVGGTFTGNVSAVDVSSTGNLIVATATPATAGAAGVAGTVAWDGDYIYVCSATDTWLRAAIATW